MANFGLAVSVSFGAENADGWKESVHMTLYKDVQLTEAEAELLRNLIVASICRIQKDGKEILGIYKVCKAGEMPDGGTLAPGSDVLQ